MLVVIWLIMFFLALAIETIFGIPQSKVFFTEITIMWVFLLIMILVSIVYEEMVQRKLGKEYATCDFFLPHVVGIASILLELVLILIVAFIISFVAKSNIFVVYEVMTLLATFFWTLTGYTDDL